MNTPPDLIMSKLQLGELLEKAKELETKPLMVDSLPEDSQAKLLTKLRDYVFNGTETGQIIEPLQSVSPELDEVTELLKNLNLETPDFIPNRHERRKAAALRRKQGLKDISSKKEPSFCLP